MNSLFGFHVPIVVVGGGDGAIADGGLLDGAGVGSATASFFRVVD
jgi:hypothetical protein